MGLFTKRSRSAEIAIQMHGISILKKFYPVSGFHEPNWRLCAHWALVIGDDFYELAALAQGGYQRAYAAMDFDRKISRSKDEVNGDNVNEWEENAKFREKNMTTIFLTRAGTLSNYDARLVDQQATNIDQAVFQTNYNPVLYSSHVFIFYLVASIKLSRGKHIQLSPSLSNKLDGGKKWHYDFEINLKDSLAIVSLIIYQIWRAGIAMAEEKPKDFRVRWEKSDEPISFHTAPWRRPKINVEHIDFGRVIPPWRMKLLLEVPRDRIAEFEDGIAERYGLQDSTAMKMFQDNSRDAERAA